MENSIDRQLVERMAAGKRKPVVLSGYVGPDQSGGSGLCIYPDRNANHYYIVDLKCPIEMVVIPDDPRARVTVVVESASQIERVTRERVPAEALAARRRRNPTAATSVATDAVRGMLIAIARATKAAGIEEITVEHFGFAGAGAGDAWNGLLEAVGTPAEGAAVDEVLAHCVGAAVQ